MKSFGDDINKIIKRMYPECDFDVSYNFFYDETNNIRKYHNQGGQLNYKGDGNFILGGIVFDNEPQVEELFKSLKLQKSIIEVKFKHIAKGDFFETLKSNKLNIILKYLSDNEMFIHYHSTNLLYFATVDIIDSAIVGSGLKYELSEINELKSILHDALSFNIDKTTELFHHFEYPNVNKTDFGKFVYHIKKNINSYKLHKNGISEIIMILDTAVSNKELPFITDETSNVFIESFFPFYYQPILIFKNSKHYFDNEEIIREAFDKFESDNSDIKHRNYIFLDSKESRLTQLADISVGLLGKFYQYINALQSIKNVSSDLKNLNPSQQENYILFINVINKAISQNPALVNNTMSITQHLILKEVLEKIV